MRPHARQFIPLLTGAYGPLWDDALWTGGLARVPPMLVTYADTDASFGTVLTVFRMRETIW
jgi:hypothetical protein